MVQRPTEPDFTIGDILEEFEQEFGPPENPIDPDECYTSQELCDIYDLPIDTVRKKLKKLRKEGKLIETTKSIPMLGRPNSMYPSPAYQIKEKTDEQD